MIKNYHVIDEKFQKIQSKKRKIITPASTFGILRKQLVKNVGLERIRDILFDFGYDTGAYDAKQALEEGECFESLVTYGPLLHIENGQIEGFEHECNFQLNEDKQVISLVGQGVWYNSYEAREHVNHLGKSDEPVCHTLIGYASGFMSTVFAEPMLAKELSCLGMGDDHCRWIVKPQKQWELETPGENHIYRDVPIVKELEYTFEQLVERERVITRLLDFQALLTNEMAKGYDMYHILTVAYESLKIPVLVESLQAYTFNYAGISSERYEELSTDFNEYTKEKGYGNTYLMNGSTGVSISKKLIDTGNQIRLISPVLVHKELMGWCSFVLETGEPKEEYYLFLDILANAVSLLLLNEKTKFETYERMKGNFLEELLSGKLPKEELLKRGLFTGVDLSIPFYISVIDVRLKNYPVEENFELREKIYESTYNYFKEQDENILVGREEHKIILYLPNSSDSVEEKVLLFINYLHNKYPNSNIKCGLSNRHDGIDHVIASYEEAVLSLKLSLNKPLVSFRSLGVIGALLTNDSIEFIDNLAKQELGELYNLDELHNIDLLETLYVFLRNGGNLKKTNSDLALSMSGLRHRITKIESILQKDLRNPEETYQLLLILKVLIITDKLKF